MKKVLYTAAVAALFASSALACDTDDLFGCMDTVKIEAMVVPTGVITSVFGGVGSSGKDDVWGNAVTNIDTYLSDGSFCDGTDCDATGLAAALFGEIDGGFYSIAENYESGEALQVASGGKFDLGLDLGITGVGDGFGAQLFGESLFTNTGVALGEGNNVANTAESWGNSIITGYMAVDEACPTCADVVGGIESTTKVGMKLTSWADSTTSGQAATAQIAGATEVLNKLGANAD